MMKSCERANSLDCFRISCFLQSYNIRVGSSNYFGDLLGATNSAFTDVVGEEAHYLSGLSIRTRYGWSISTSRTY